MPEPLKNMYSPAFFDRFSDFVIPYIPGFNKKTFVSGIFDEEWDKRELKERVRHTSTVLSRFLPGDFAEAMAQLVPLSKALEQEKISKYGFEFMFLPDYIEQYGIDHYEASVNAIEVITQFISCEFAVRPFIKKYGKKMMEQMLAWSEHPHHHVRRLSSEGCRPRLPWAMALPQLKKDPSPILPVLENLKNDDSEFVRRSVANNLNDISRDNPDIALSVFKRWKGHSELTDRIVKHGCRTLLKQAHPEALLLFGFSSVEFIAFSNFKLKDKVIKTGDDLRFSFDIKNKADTPKLIRLEYAIYFLLANSTHSRKVFQIKEKSFQPEVLITISRKHSFRVITTRKYYPGMHKISIIANGKEFESLEFELVGK